MKLPRLFIARLGVSARNDEARGKCVTNHMNVSMSYTSQHKSVIIPAVKVFEIGEFGLIELLAEMAYRTRDKRKEAWHKLVIGIGDDTAAWQGDASIQLATIDALIQNVHFSLDTASWEEVGWKALAVNLSDIAAMGGLPRYALVSLALSNNTEVEDVTALYTGMIDLAQQFEVVIAGGNISSSPQLAIHIALLGSTASRDKRRFVEKSFSQTLSPNS